MDGFDFEDSLSGLEDSFNKPAYVPAPKKKNLKEMFSDGSDNDKPNTQKEKSKLNLY